MNQTLNQPAVTANGQIRPEVGMGATIVLFSDRIACTIVWVSPSGKEVWVKRDHAVRTDSNGMSDNQTYSYSPNHDAYEASFTLRKNGGWMRKGNGKTGSNTLLVVGVRNHYHDFGF